MKASLCFLLAAAMLALCAAQQPVFYRAVLAPVPTYVRPNRTTLPSGNAIATVFNSTYATIAFDFRSVVGATMAHIHNGTVTMQGPPVVWAFQSSLPGTSALNPVSGSFAGTVAFNPTTTGVGNLLANNMAYFNVHSAMYPGGLIQGNFVRRTSGKK